MDGGDFSRFYKILVFLLRGSVFSFWVKYEFVVVVVC